MRDAITRKIEDMKKITIFVYENASFEVENIPIEPIADSEITSHSMKLFALPEADELTGKEMKNIAKLQLVVEMIEGNGYKTELMFDSERVQKFKLIVFFRLNLVMRTLLFLMHSLQRVIAVKATMQTLWL